MSSGQWEVVGKSKKSQNGKIKTKEDEKKAVKNGPKLEDVVPHSQIKSFYSGMEIDDVKPAKEKKKDGDKKKKQDKKNAEPPKPKPPKTIEAELANIITSNKIRFSNAPLVWLKEVAAFLNSKTQIDVEDPTFSSYPALFPLSAVPDEIRKSLSDVLHDAGKANAQLFFDVTLTALANDMSRGQSVNGHRLLLQMLAQDYPEFCVTSVQKSASLRNSYQNRPPIGLSLLWAFGQGGNSDFAVGLKGIIPSYIELKNYTKYVVGYLSNLLDEHGTMENTKVSQDQLFAMIDMVNNKRSALPKDLSSDLIKQLSKYKDIYFNKSNNKLQVTFNQLMKKLPNQYLSGASLDPYHRVLVDCLVDCLVRDDSFSKKLRQKSLKMTVLQYKEVCGEALKGKKKDETVVKTNKICQDILDRMTSTRRFPWIWASFFLLVGIAGLVSYDVSRAGGNFPKSATGRLLNDLGVLEHSQRAWQKTLSTSARGYLWLETNAPVYYTQTVETCTPYVLLSREFAYVALKKIGVLYTNTKDYVADKTPVVVATIDQYAPGLVDNVQSYASTGFQTIKKYSNDYYQLTAEYLKTKVFVGDWAPEILQNKTETALNVTRSHVSSSYFHWFREQVHIYSKIP
ncbi:hypothetical protein HW555_006372 [Spodoptera exigua]|uniref:Uncharacterized protein n=1 Tax=Spodoptera exigua TaxID=7107 RepID=A0A835GER3_SPOEX|nr:hypothetical protein HW555_006372 [Spodoptera exigua]